MGTLDRKIKEALNSMYGADAKIFNHDVEVKLTEKWIWVDGYKATHDDMTCHGEYKYDIGKQHDMPEDAEIKVCDSGFHFCLDLGDVFNYYGIGGGNRFFKVSALVRESDYEKCRKDKESLPGIIFNPFYKTDKLAAKSIIFTREISADEVFIAYKENDNRCSDWTLDQFKRAMETSVSEVEAEIQLTTLTGYGYAEEMADYIIKRLNKYDLAVTLAKQDGVTMDTKIDILFRSSTGPQGLTIRDMYPGIFNA